MLATLAFITGHPLNSRRPWAALWRYAHWQVTSRVREEIEIDWIDGAKLVVRRGMTGATGNIYCGLHEFAEMGFLLHALRPEDLFIDVGANVGCYTVLASAVCGARTLAVEPDDIAMHSLMQNLKVNGIEERVRAVATALGSQKGQVRFTFGRDTTNRIATDADTHTREVRMECLDDIVSGTRPTFMKLDVEGHEAMVLAGAAKTLQDPSLLAIESEDYGAETVALLDAAGFKRFRYDPFTRELTPNFESRSNMAPAFNALFVRDVEACEQRIKMAPARLICSQLI